MAIAEVFTSLCAGMLVVTAVVHSLLGERRLIGPLLELRAGVLVSPLARFLLRAVWHFMSVAFAIIALGLVASLGGVASFGGADRVVAALLWGTAIGIGGAGIYDAIGSKGRHIGWPMLVSIGASAALALVFRN